MYVFIVYALVPHYSAPSKVWFSENFFWILSMFAIVNTKQKNLIFFKIDDFFYLLPVRANLLSGTYIFSLKIFFYTECKKLKRIFSFWNMFLKNKKRVNWSNNIVKTKKCTISFEIGIFHTFLKSCFNMRQ